MDDTERSDAVRTSSDGAVRRITLARPDARNALDAATVRDLAHAFAHAAVDGTIRVVLLGGDGPVFCAGADVAHMRSMADADEAENLADAEALADLFQLVHGCPKPVVARVQGAAFGGGLGLVAAADIAVAAEGTRFALSEARLGLAPAVIAPYVVRRIGIAAASDMALTGEPIDARRAREIGLVAHVAEDGALDAAVDERIRALLSAGPAAQAAIKALLDLVSGDPAAHRSATARIIARLRASDEAREGLTAFLERRPPAWVRNAARPDTGREEG